jgi:tetratricopeptide (TPR) repeat protein
MDAANRAIALDSAKADAWLARGFLLIPIPGGADGQDGFRVIPGLGGGAPMICWSRVTDCRTAAREALEQAVRLAPRSAEAWYQLGRAHTPVESGSSAVEQSLVLEPDRAVSAWLIGLHQLMRERADSAERMLDSAIALGRRDLSVYSLRMEARLARNDPSGAAEDLASYRALMGGDPLAAAYAASVLVGIDARTGRGNDATRRADSLFAANSVGEVRQPMLLVLAAALTSAGHDDRAIATLDRAVGQTAGGFWSAFRAPRWQPLRTDSRFQAMAARMEATR